jgi:hypothetical protein
MNFSLASLLAEHLASADHRLQQTASELSLSAATVYNLLNTLLQFLQVGRPHCLYNNFLIPPVSTAWKPANQTQSGTFVISVESLRHCFLP